MASSITKGAIVSYISIVLSIVLTFLYTPWMINKIGVSQYGIYSLVISFISYFIMDFGLSSTVSRYIAKYRAEGDENKVTSVLGLVSKVYLIIDAAIFTVLLILYFFITAIFKGLSEEEISVFKVLYIIAGGFSVINFFLKPFDGVLYAFEFFVEAKTLDMLQKLVTIGLIALILLSSPNVYALVIVNGAVAFVVSLSKYLIFKKKTRLRIDYHYFDFPELKSMLYFSIWVFLTTLAQQFRLSSAPIILGMTSNSEQISVFSVGRSIEGIVFTLAAALNGLFLPKVSRLVYNKDVEGVTNLMIRVGRLQLYVIACILFGFVILGKCFVNLWVGPSFSDVYIIVLLLLVTNIVGLTQHIGTTMTYAKNEVRKTAIITISTSFISMICSFFVSRFLGAVGCAICICFCLVINLILLNIFYSKVLGIDVRRFFKECHGKILPALLVYSTVFYFACSWVEYSSWIMLILIGLSFLLGYCCVCYFFLFNPYEHSLIETFIGKRIKNRLNIR